MSQEKKAFERPLSGPVEAGPGRQAAIEGQGAERGVLFDEGEQIRAEQERLKKLRRQILQVSGEGGGGAETVEALGGRAGSEKVIQSIEGSGTNSQMGGAALEALIVVAHENKQK